MQLCAHNIKLRFFHTSKPASYKRASHILTFAKLVECAIIFRDVVFLEVLDGVGVLHPLEGLLGRLERWVELFDKGGVFGIGHDSRRHVAHEILDSVEQLLELDEGAFGLDVRVFGQMPTRARLFRAV